MGNEIFGHSFTNSSDPNWVPEPGTRGTFSILSVCLVTLGLCVWTAIHLNVPEHREPGWKQLMRKIGWLMLSLLSPEIVAYTAFQQYVQAKSLVNTMNKHSPSHRKGFTGILTSWLPCLLRRRQEDEEDSSTTTVNTVEKWTMVHGFLALMGGLAIEIRDNDPAINDADSIVNFLPTQNITKIQWERKRLAIKKSQRQRTRLTLTPKGLQFLKEHGHEKLIPDLSENRIKDKSKGSAFAKTFVCIQASWFCVQCLTRFAQGLAISLLELNTLGHAICTLFIYALWWDKPLDIVEPETVLIHPSTKEKELGMAKLIAAMCSTSRLDKEASEADHLHVNCRMFTFPVHRDTKGSGWHIDLSGQLWKSQDRRLHLEPSRHFWDKFIVNPFVQIMPRAEKIPELYVNVVRSSALLEMVRLRSHNEHAVTLWSDDGGKGDWDSVKLLERSMQDSTKERFFSAFRPPDSLPYSASTTEIPRIVIQYSDMIRWQLALEYVRSRIVLQRDPSMPPKDSFTDRIRNLPRFQDYDHYLPLFIGFGFVGLIYGGLHCVAWNAPFTTSIERILWRISSITIAATGVLVACVFSWTRLPPFWQEYSYDALDFVDHFMDIIDDILIWSSGFNLGVVLAKFVERQPLYKNYRLVKVLCDMAAWLLLFPHILLFLLALFLFCLLKVIFDIFTISFIVLYVLARIYLVVISFINLAHLPDSAYQLPQWSRYVPHIG